MLQTLMISGGILLVLLVFVFLLAQYFVLPSMGEIGKLNSEVTQLQSSNKELSSRIGKVKELIEEELNVNQSKVLRQFISANCSNLNNDLVVDAAKSIVKAAHNNKVSLPLLVGVSYATTGFNTTFNSGYEAGILSVPLSLHNNWYVADSKREPQPERLSHKELNVSTTSANAGAALLFALLDKHSNIRYALNEYLENRPPKEREQCINRIFEASTAFEVELHTEKQKIADAIEEEALLKKLEAEKDKKK